MRKAFRDRDPVRMGVFGMGTVALLVFLAFNVTTFQGGTGYKAAFTEASGLKPNEEVRIAGVKVGTVKTVGLEGDHVKVGFNLNNSVHFGTLSRVDIKISTILGSHYLDLVPGGAGRQSPHKEIPTSRTAPSYEVVPALQDLSGQLQRIDIPQLGKAFDTLSQTLSSSPENVRQTLAGLRKVSRTVASRDDQLSDLLGHTSDVSGLLADRRGDLAKLVSDGSLLFQEVDARSGVIQSLLTGTVSLSQQITGTVQENQATLNPALVQLHRVVSILERDQGNLQNAIHTLEPFVTTSADGTASGRWFDGYLQNLIPIPAGIAPPTGGLIAPPDRQGKSPAGTQGKSPAGRRTPATTSIHGGNPLPLIK